MHFSILTLYIILFATVIYFDILCIHLTYNGLHGLSSELHVTNTSYLHLNHQKYTSTTECCYKQELAYVLNFTQLMEFEILSVTCRAGPEGHIPYILPSSD